MSFKREGDDKNLLDVLQKRRVRDLLYEDVPNDEMTQLSNGRLTCLVCPHRPIFDTLNMLVQHRKGKKHEANALYREQEKIEVERLIDRRKQEQFLKTGSTDIQQALPSVPSGSLGGRVPYDPRVKKRSKPYERRTKLDLDQISHTGDVTAIQSTETSDVIMLPGNRDNYNSKTQHHRAFNHSENEKSVSNRVVNKQSSISTSKTSNPSWYCKSDNEVIEAKNLNKLINPKSCEQGVKHYIARRKLKADISAQISKTGNSIISEVGPSVVSTSWSSFKISSRSLPSTQNIKNVETRKESSIEKPASSLKTENTSISTCAVQQDRAVKLLQLREAGWKRDWDGKWVRDEDAEFDSDEETPELS